MFPLETSGFCQPSSSEFEVLLISVGGSTQSGNSPSDVTFKSMLNLNIKFHFISTEKSTYKLNLKEFGQKLSFKS